MLSPRGCHSAASHRPPLPARGKESLSDGSCLQVKAKQGSPKGEQSFSKLTLKMDVQRPLEDSWAFQNTDDYMAAGINTSAFTGCTGLTIQTAANTDAALSLS